MLAHSAAGNKLHRADIVVPCIKIDALTLRCIEECKRLCQGAEIHVLPDVAPDSPPLGPSVQITVTGPVTIATKRNIAAKKSTAEFLAFIDSDAYPIDGWLDNAIRNLDQRTELGAVGGPNLSPPDQTGAERLVGAALRSPFVSGKGSYRKIKCPARLVDDLPSCNLIVRREIYLNLNGMNEALFTGEDMEFCARLQLAGHHILYTPDVCVYHKNRNYKSFVLQRLTYGASVPALLNQGLRFNFLLLCLPAAFLIYLLTLPLSFLWPPYLVIYMAVCAVYVLIVVIEAIRHSDDARSIPGTAAILIIGNLAPGVGTIAQFLGVLPSRRKLYKNFE